MYYMERKSIEELTDLFQKTFKCFEMFNDIIRITTFSRVDEAFKDARKEALGDAKQQITGQPRPNAPQKNTFVAKIYREVKSRIKSIAEHWFGYKQKAEEDDEGKGLKVRPLLKKALGYSREVVRRGFGETI